MKPLAWLFATVILGSSVGVAAAYIQYGQTDHVFGFSKPDALSRIPSANASPLGPAPVASVANGRPRVQLVEDATFDFGVMSRNERRSHEFVVRNAGDAPLTIAFVDKTCQCTDVEISRTEVPPNETAEIKLIWQPSTFRLDFHQTARFRTNDPGRIELDLTVKGRVQQIVQAVPRSVQFGPIPSGEGRAASFDVFFYRDANLQVDHVELNDAASGEFLTTRIEPLSADELAHETGAVNGQRVFVELAPGLPVGRLRQQLRVHLSDPELGAVEVPIDAEIVGNLRLIGKGYGSDGVWDLGTLPGDREHESKLFILFPQGEDIGGIKMRVVNIDPDSVLSAEITPPRAGATSPRFAVSLRVRPIDRLVNRLGSQQGDLAEIVIETTSPTAPIIRIPVAFAIESNNDALNREDK